MSKQGELTGTGKAEPAPCTVLHHGTW